MTNKAEITVVIPTYNRYDKLLRLLKYYKKFGFPFPILILDSGTDKTKSAELEEIIADEHITYKPFDSSIFLTNKIYEGLLYVQTPFVVLNADDDFLIPGSVEEAVSFLKVSPDYSLCEGIHINYRINEESSTVLYGKLYAQMRSIEQELPSKRINSFLPNYFPIFYGVYKTELLCTNFEKTISETDDLRFFELLPAMLTAASGKIKILDKLFIVLEESALSTGATTDTLMDFKRKNIFEGKYLKFKACLTEAICKNENITSDDSNAVVDKAMRRYLIIGIPSFLFSFRRIILFFLNRTPLLNKLYLSYNKVQQKKKLGPFTYDSPSDPNYQAFCVVKTTIEDSLNS